MKTQKHAKARNSFLITVITITLLMGCNKKEGSHLKTGRETSFSESKIIYSNQLIPQQLFDNKNGRPDVNCDIWSSHDATDPSLMLFSLAMSELAPVSNLTNDIIRYANNNERDYTVPLRTILRTSHNESQTYGDALEPILKRYADNFGLYSGVREDRIIEELFETMVHDGKKWDIEIHIPVLENTNLSAPPIYTPLIKSHADTAYGWETSIINDVLQIKEVVLIPDNAYKQPVIVIEPGEELGTAQYANPCLGSGGSGAGGSGNGSGGTVPNARAIALNPWDYPVGTQTVHLFFKEFVIRTRHEKLGASEVRYKASAFSSTFPTPFNLVAGDISKQNFLGNVSKGQINQHQIVNEWLFQSFGSQKYDRVWLLVYEYDWFAGKKYKENPNCGICQLYFRGKFSSDVYFDNSAVSLNSAKDITFQKFVGNDFIWVEEPNGKFKIQKQ